MTKQHEPWAVNPLVTLIRIHGADSIASTVRHYEAEHGYKGNVFDLSIQVMIVACSYDPGEVWQAKTNDVAIAAEYIAKGAPDMAGEVLDAAIENGDVWLNRPLIDRIAAQQLARIHALHDTWRQKLGVPGNADPAVAYFAPGAELAKFKLNRPNTAADLYHATAYEKHSKERVYFRPVGRALSKAYVESFHYLHTAREDDVLAYGAFLEGQDMPLALVTYAPVGRAYKRRMLRSAGIDPAASLELTRGWNSEFAPKNTMSLLYAYAHAAIQQHYAAQTKALGILTAVNPNLGFKGSAFRAVGFGLVGEKPTVYQYVAGAAGSRVFGVRRSFRQSGQGPRTASAAFPLLPTKELAVVLAGTQRLTPKVAPCIVSESEYRHDTQYLGQAGSIAKRK